MKRKIAPPHTDILVLLLRKEVFGGFACFLSADASTPQYHMTSRAPKGKVSLKSSRHLTRNPSPETMVVQSKRRLVAYLFLLLVALTGSQATPCSGTATLDFSVDGNGDVSLTLNTDRYKDEHELWTFDFESHRDDTLAIVDRSLFPGTFGSCATVKKRLDTPEAFAADFDPVASGGGTFIQTFRKGTTPPSPRKDAFEYAGSLAELLECKTSRDEFVFSATTFEDESTIAATVYATCFGSLDPLNVSVPIVRSETSFPVRVEASRTAVGTASAGATIASIVALPSLVYNAPNIVDGVGLTRFDVEVTFDVTSMTPSQGEQYVLYNPDVTPTFVPTGSSAWSMAFVRNLAGENSGRCQLSKGFCTQTLFYRIACIQSNPLANVRATLEGRFTFNLKEESCDNKDPTAAAASCAETGVTSSFTISPIVRLSVIGGLDGVTLGVGLATSALINLNTGNDALVKNVVAGERLSWQLQVTPASKRSRYSVQLRKLLLCPFNQAVCIYMYIMIFILIVSSSFCLSVFRPVAA